jgi:hypothetical protein
MKIMKKLFIKTKKASMGKKKLTQRIAFLFILFLLIHPLLMFPGDYDLRFTQMRTNSDSTKFYIDVDIRASSIHDTFAMGTSNITFAYNSSALGDPKLYRAYAFSSAPYAAMSVSNPIQNVLSLNIIYLGWLSGIPGVPVDSSWIRICTLEFSLLEPYACGNFAFHDESQALAPCLLMNDRNEVLNQNLILNEEACDMLSFIYSPAYALKFDSASTDTASGRLFLTLFIRSAKDSFRIGNSKIVFSYNAGALASAAIDRAYMCDSGDYSKLSLNETASAVLTLNIEYKGADDGGALISNEWSPLAVFSFRIKDAPAAAAFVFHNKDSLSHPTILRNTSFLKDSIPEDTLIRYSLFPLYEPEQIPALSLRFEKGYSNAARTEYYIDVAVKARDSLHDFRMGKARILFSYDTLLLEDPALYTAYNWKQDAYDAMGFSVQGNGFISLDINYKELNNGQHTGSEWKKIAMIKFDLRAHNSCSWLRFSDTLSQPATSILTDMGVPLVLDTLYAYYFCPFKGKISGVVYHDENGDCIRGNDENGIGERIIEILPGPHYTSTDKEGKYETFLEPGNYQISLVPDHNNYTYWNLSPCQLPAYNVDVQIDSIRTGNDFATLPVASVYDLRVKLIGHQGWYVNEAYYEDFYLLYDNIGTRDIASGMIRLMHKAQMNFIQATPKEDLYSDPFITWNFSNLKAGETRLIQIRMFVPKGASIGDTLCFYLESYHGQNDSDMQNNFYVLCPEVKALIPFESNCKINHPAGDISQETHYIDFVVRFQNVGNGIAQRVTVIDTIDNEHLPLTEIRLMGSSHPYDFRVHDNVLIWVFDDIMLADSSMSDLQSRGFLWFRAWLAPDLALGTVIENEAHIFFDYANFLITNRTMNRIEDFSETVLVSEEKQGFLVYPNPSNAVICIENSDPVSRSFFLYDNTGRMLEVFLLKPREKYFYHFGQKPQGLYFLKREDAAVMKILFVK